MDESFQIRQSALKALKFDTDVSSPYDPRQLGQIDRRIADGDLNDSDIQENKRLQCFRQSPEEEYEVLQDQIYKRKFDIEMKKSMEKAGSNAGRKNQEGGKVDGRPRQMDDKLYGEDADAKHMPMQSYLSKSSNANMQTTMMTSQIRGSAITNFQDGATQGG